MSLEQVEQVEAGLLEGAENGDPHALGDLYASDALLDASLPGPRVKARGPVEIVDYLRRSWPGQARLVEWTPKIHPEGLELWMERVGGDGKGSRQRHYVHVDDGRIIRHWVYAAPPRTPPPDAPAEGQLFLDPALVADLGDVVEHESIVSRGWSGNVLERLVLAGGQRLIAKRIVPGANWLERHTNDQGREALLFRDGILGRLPDELDPATVATKPDGEAWWVVMRDVSGLLLPEDHRISREENRRVLQAANTMWEEFWGETVPHLATLSDRLVVSGPRISALERGGVDLLPKQLDVFWEAFAEAVDADVSEAVLSLMDDPEPLVDELDSCGTTMIHGDLRDEQLGIADDRIIALDWGVATQGHPAVDFAWYLVHDAWRIDATHDEIVDDFRRARGEADDPRALDLGMIAGLMMYGWIFGHSAAYHPDPAERQWARWELDWWEPRVRRALETWSP